MFAATAAVDSVAALVSCATRASTRFQCNSYQRMLHTYACAYTRARGHSDSSACTFTDIGVRACICVRWMHLCFIGRP